MTTPDQNSRRPSSIEDRLTGARFEPDADFANALHARLLAALPPHVEPSQSRSRSLLHRILMMPEHEGNSMSNRFRMMTAFSALVLLVMVGLFVVLVLFQPSRVAAPTQEPVSVASHTVFADTLELLESKAAQTNEGYKFELHWRPLVQPTTDYHIFIHALSGNQITGQMDGRLLGDDLTSSLSTDHDLPTTSWLPDRFISSIVTLTLNANQPSPDTLVMGLYNPETGERLVVMQDGVSVSDGQVVVWSALAISDQPTSTAPPTEAPASPKCSPENRCLSEDGRFWLHTVRPGDTLVSIAADYNSSLPCILRENGYTSGMDVLVPPAQILVCIEQPVASDVNQRQATGYQTLTMSADAQWIAIETQPAAGTWPAIWLHNLDTSETSRIATGAWPSLSADGSQVAFVITPPGNPVEWNRENLVNIYSGGFTDISSSISDLYGVACTMPVISADGQTVAFLARTVAAESLNNSAEEAVWVYDRRTNTAETAPAYSDDTAPFLAGHPGMSADGRYIVFSAGSTGNGPSGIVLWDREKGFAAIVANGFFPEISADGSTITYLESVGEAQQAVGWINAMAYNVQTGESRWLGAVLDQGPDGWWEERVLSPSADGHKIAFTSVLDDPRNPGPVPTPGGGLGSAFPNRHIYLYDWATDSVTRVDNAPDLHIDGFSYQPAISADGQKVAYLWHRPGEQFGIFLYDVSTDATTEINLIDPATGNPVAAP